MIDFVTVKPEIYFLNYAIVFFLKTSNIKKNKDLEGFLQISRSLMCVSELFILFKSLKGFLKLQGYLRIIEHIPS